MSLTTQSLANSSLGPSYRTHGLTYRESLGYPVNFTQFKNVKKDAPKGGTLRIGLTGKFDSFTPNIIAGNAAPYIETLTAPKLGHTPSDDPYAVYGLVAKEYEIALDKTWMIIHLRPEARWHDNSPITSSDVVFSIKTFQQLQSIYYKYLLDVDEVKALDAHRVFLHTKNPTNRELFRLIAGLAIISEAYYKTHPYSKTSLNIPLSAGPYRVESFQPAHSITYARVKDYWAKDLPVQVGQYNFERIIIDFFYDDDILFEAFKAGQVDMFRESKIGRWKTGYEFPAARAGNIEKVEIPHEGASTSMGVAFNLRLPLFQNRKVREALNEAFDFNTFNRLYYWDYAERFTSFFHNSKENLIAIGLPDASELKYLEPLKDKVPKEVFEKNFIEQESVYRSFRERLTKAHKLLTEAGYTVAPSNHSYARMRIDPKTQRPIVIKFLTTNKDQERFALFYREALLRLGINLQVQTIDSAHLTEEIRYQRYEALFISVWGYDFPGNELYDSLHSEHAMTVDSNNVLGIQDPVVDQLINVITQSQKRSEVQAAARALDRVMMWNRYYLPLWQDKYDYRLAHWKKFGKPHHSNMIKFKPLTEWWSIEAKP